MVYWIEWMNRKLIFVEPREFATSPYNFEALLFSVIGNHLLAYIGQLFAQSHAVNKLLDAEI